MGLEGPRDVGGDEAVAAGEGHVGPELLLDLLVPRELAQALGDLPAVLDHKEPQVAIPLEEHEVVCLPDLLGEGSEWEEGVCEAGAGECPDNTVEEARLGWDGGHLSRVGVDLGVPGGHLVIAE